MRKHNPERNSPSNYNISSLKGLYGKDDCFKLSTLKISIWIRISSIPNAKQESNNILANRRMAHDLCRFGVLSNTSANLGFI